MAVREELDTLKNSLKKLDSHLVESTNGFDGQVGKVPMHGSVNEGTFKLTPTTKDYSQKALQATFNIAEIAHSSLNFTGIIGLLTGNGKVLRNSFNYLDNKWVPKIVDETTYQTGLALQNFLKQILPPKNANEQERDAALNSLFDFIPLGKSKVISKVKGNNSLQVLFDMQELLDARLEFYEKVIKEEAIAETLEVYDIKMQRRAIWDEKLSTPSKKIQETLKELSQTLQQTTSSQVCKEIKSELLKLKEKLHSLELINEKWHQDNLAIKLKNQNSLPDEIALNDLLLYYYPAQRNGEMSEMMFSAAIEGPLNAGIASGTIPNEYQERIATSLADTYGSGSKLINALNEQIQSLTESATKIQEKIETIKEYLEKNSITLPEFKLASSDLNPKEQLESNQALLEEFQEALKETSAAKIKFNEQVDLLDGDETFKQYLENHVKVINEDNFDSQIESIETSIEKIKLAIEKNEKAIAKSSKQGRSKELATLAKKVNSTYRARHQSSAVLSRAEQKQRDAAQTVKNEKIALHQQYEEKVKKISTKKDQKIKAVSSEHTIIKETKKEFSERRQILTESKPKIDSLFSKIKEAS